MMTYAKWAALLTAIVFAGECYAAEPKTPVVIVPGIVGSNLCEAPSQNGGAPGKQLWGAGLFYMGRLKQLNLPLDEKAGSPVVPCGLLEKFAVLGPFEIGVYSGLTRFLKESGYLENESLFIFDYDWRQSNFDTAELLRKRIEQIKAQTHSEKVSIVAHSMGGIVSRIYLQSLGGNTSVDAMVFLGTPHQGATQVMRTANDGWGWLPNWFAGGEDVIREVMFSWPSVYELIPLAKCCATQTTEAPFSLAEATNWQKLTWLPGSYHSQSGLEFIRKRVERSLRLRALLQKPLPEGPYYEYIVSGGYPTADIAVFDSGYTTTLEFTEARGDESVTLASSSDGDLPRARLVSQKHANIFDDDLAHFYIASALKIDTPALTAKFALAPNGAKRDLRFDLESNPFDVCTGLSEDELNPLKEGSVQAVLVGDDGSRVCISSFRLDTSARVASVGSEMTATLVLGGYTPQFTKELTPTIRIVDDSGVAGPTIAPARISVSYVNKRPRVTYLFSFTAPSKEGLYQIEAAQNGLLEHSASTPLICLEDKDGGIKEREGRL